MVLSIQRASLSVCLYVVSNRYYSAPYYFYTIGGWVLKYFTLFITGSGKNAVADGYFTGFITGQWAPIIFGVVYLLITAAFVMSQ